MRGRKSDVYRGGVRVPLFIRNPTLSDVVEEIETSTAHIDMLPTIASICKVTLPGDRILDGKNLTPLMTGIVVDWENRPLFFNWTRKYPELYNNVALQKGQFKLVGHANYNANLEDFELFDLKNDPYELSNIVRENLPQAEELKAELDRIFNKLINSKHLIDPPKILVGTEHENPVILNRNDAHGQRGIWAQEQIYGYWKVQIKEGHYDIKFKFIKPLKDNGRMILETSTLIHQMNVNDPDSDILEMKNVYLPDLKGEMRPLYTSKSGNIFPFWVEMERID
jgi:arylsulfatase